MLKTTLRILGLMLIVAGAFYCGRASNYAKSDSIAAENSVEKYPTIGLRDKSNGNHNVEFQLQKNSLIFDSTKDSIYSEKLMGATTVKWNHLPGNIPYYLEWDEEKGQFIYQNKPLENTPEIFNFMLAM
jgi:hypothetical protein